MLLLIKKKHTQITGGSGGTKRGMRGICAPPWRLYLHLAPPPPPSEGKMAKISYFRKFFEFLAPTYFPSMPPKKDFLVLPWLGEGYNINTFFVKYLPTKFISGMWDKNEFQFVKTEK